MAALTILGCSEGAPDGLSVESGDLRVEVHGADLGLDFVHESGARGAYYYVEIMSAGGGVFDFDGDGDLDVYATQGVDLDGDLERRDRLFLNQGNDAEGRPRFADTSDVIRASLEGYGMGVAAGDFDGDGWVDLYVTQLGRNVLLRNVEGRELVDVTEKAGVAGAETLSTSAAFVDLDRDGLLDLYVVNYLVYSREKDRECIDLVGLREYCGPQSYAPERDVVYRNLGGGRFADVTAAVGIDLSGPGLGVITGDFDADGWTDVYVANDQAANHLWSNEGLDEEQGFVRFVEQAPMRGAAVDQDGKVEASMGVDAADVDSDGDEDLLMTHLIGETNTLYLNDGAGFFTDSSLRFASGRGSLPWTGFGCAFVDLDLDGRIDLLVANGAVRANLDQRAAGDPFPYREPNLVFLQNDGGDLTSSRVLSAETPIEVSRGLATGDLDNDGDLDWLVFNLGGPLQLHWNRSPADGWIGLDLRTADGRPALGATIRAENDQGAQLLRRVRSEGSYLSSRDPRVVLGLEASAPVEVEITWPDGERQTVENLEPGRYHRIDQETR